MSECKLIPPNINKPVAETNNIASKACQSFLAVSVEQYSYKNALPDLVSFALFSFLSLHNKDNLVP